MPPENNETFEEVLPVSLELGCMLDLYINENEERLRALLSAFSSDVDKVRLKDLIEKDDIHG